MKEKTTGKTKRILSLIGSKIVVFIFCVLFISGYNALFGAENSIVGVIILMGLLMFLKQSFGFKASRAAILIPILFVLTGLFAKLGSFHPVIGLAANFIMLLLILQTTAQQVESPNYLPFLMGYIMFTGYDVSGVLFAKRMLSLLVGGVLIGVIYYFTHKKDGITEGLFAQIKAFKLLTAVGLWQLKLVVTIPLTIFVGTLCGFEKTMWIALTVLSLITPLSDESKKRRQLRLFGCIIGCIVFFMLFEVIIPPQSQAIVILMAGFLSTFITSYFLKTIYNSFSALTTAVILFPVHDAILFRVMANLIGVLVACVSTYLFDKIFEVVCRKKGITKEMFFAVSVG